MDYSADMVLDTTLGRAQQTRQNVCSYEGAAVTNNYITYEKVVESRVK